MSYQLEVSPAAREEIRRLPGHVRQRARCVISALAHEPRPVDSKRLDFALAVGEPRRARMDRWRIIYAVIETDLNLVAVLAVRHRPPYGYDDLPEIFSGLM